jgi:hypothetical protein
MFGVQVFILLNVSKSPLGAVAIPRSTPRAAAYMFQAFSKSTSRREQPSVGELVLLAIEITRFRCTIS